MTALRGMSVAQARRALAEKFRAAGIESPELDARILVGHALGLDHAGLAAAERQELSAADRVDDRRAGGAPPGARAGRAHYR